MEALHADALLLAHHQDDQAETVLMRLLRGAGTAGLGGMRLQDRFGSGLLLRPFLTLSKGEITAAMKRNDLCFCQDESNALPCCLRNRLRLEAMPLLQSYQPQASLHMAQTALRLQWDEDCLSSLAEDALQAAALRTPCAYALRTNALQSLPKAIGLRAIRKWFQLGVACVQGAAFNNSAMVERSLFHEDSLRLYNLVMKPEQRCINLPQGLQAERTAAFVHLLRQDGAPLASHEAPTPVPLPAHPGEYHLGAYVFRLSPLADSSVISKSATALCLSSALLASGLALRYPLKGDSIRPFGAAGSKPLRRYFTDRKVDSPFRPAWPLLTLDSNVLWVAGVGAAEATRIADHQAELWLLELVTPLPYPC